MKRLKRINLVSVLIMASLLLISCADRKADRAGQTESKVESDTDDRLGFRQYCSEEQREFLDRIVSEKPVSVIYDKNQEASERFTITDTDTICELVQALCDIGIEAPTEIYSTDSDDIFTFIMDDENNYSFSFNGHNFEAEDGKLYTVTDKAGFWKMALQIADSE